MNKILFVFAILALFSLRSNCLTKCPAEAGLKSGAAKIPVSVIFENHRKDSIHIYWVNYNGQRTLYSEVEAGSSQDQETFATHPWVVTDSAGNCLYLFIAAASGNYDVIVG